MKIRKAAQRAAWRAKNTAKISRDDARRNKAWAIANPEKVRARNARYYAADPKKYNRRSRAWQIANPRKVLAGKHARLKSPAHRAKRLASRCGHAIEIPLRPVPKTCDCCHRKSKRSLHLDHCHRSGRFMGWTCDGCNSGTGLADTIKLLELRISYLKRANARIKRVPDNQVTWAHPRKGKIHI